MNFQCADLICKFCGFLAQVKATTSIDGALPAKLLGGAWRPQHEQILAGIFQPLYVAVFSPTGRLTSIHYVPAHILQSVPTVFEPRNPLRSTAKRAGWTGFNYNLSKLPPIGVQEVFRAPVAPTLRIRAPRPPSRPRPQASVVRDRAGARVTLHEAMAQVLRDRGNQPMPSGKLAGAVNDSGLYARADGKPVHSGQIAARRAKYPHLFELTADGIRLVDLP